MGNPAGLYVHWPACKMPGMGVWIAFRILGNLLSAGMGSLLNAQPTMAPWVFPEIFSRVMGVEENLWMIDFCMPG